MNIRKYFKMKMINLMLLSLLKIDLNLKLNI